jgi:hypothetical protein
MDALVGCVDRVREVGNEVLREGNLAGARQLKKRQGSERAESALRSESIEKVALL